MEGGDGVGKSTQIALLVRELEALGREVVTTREPGGTELGGEIRRLLLHGEHVAPRAEALLFAADRAQHVATLIRPALERGAVVVTDRYLDSSLAYQGAARSLPLAEVRDLSLWATESLLPDLTILLDADPEEAVKRAQARAGLDRLEREPDSFRVALRRQFLALAEAEPERFLVLDARQSIEEIAEQISAEVLRRLALADEEAGAATGAATGAEMSAPDTAAAAVSPNAGCPARDEESSHE